MKYQVKFAKRFKQDLKKCQKRGLDANKLKRIVAILESGRPLPKQYKDHSLVDAYKGRRECHIQPDWLLVYKQSGVSMIFERTGTHSDLFR